MIKYIDKNGNLQQVNTQNSFALLEGMVKIGNMYYEKRVEKKEVIDYKKLLKENGVKATHLLSVEKSKAKCEDLGLL